MMGGLRIYWPMSLVILILSVSWCCNLSEARHHQHQKPAVVTGAVFCDTCFQDENIKGSHYISGATVAVECAEGSSRPAFYQEVKTDEQGNFQVQLPFSVSKHVKKIEGCNVKLVKSSEPYCAVASTATSSLIHLKERKGGKHIYSAGFFTFKPLKQPGLCNQQPSVTNSQLNSLDDIFDPQFPTFPTTPESRLPTFPTTPDSHFPTFPTTPIPHIPLFPTTPIPQLPTFPAPTPPASTEPYAPIMPYLPRLPPLLPLPPLPKLPTLPFMPPVTTNPATPIGPFKDSKVENGLVTQPQQLFPPIIPPVLAPPQGPLPLPPNPLQPAPLLPNPLQPPAPPLIPNPFQPPSPPPSLLPPTPPLPNLPLPPIPGLTPTPSPPPPASSFPLPPIIPLPPGLPRIPGFPPVKAKKVNP